MRADRANTLMNLVIFYSMCTPLKPIAMTDLTAYRAWVEAQPVASVVIDCATAEVLAANNTGRHFLGLLQTTRLPVSLDGAMPAINALRQLARHDLTERVRQHLVFWRLGHLANAICDVGPAGQNCSSHLAIQFCDESDDDSASLRDLVTPTGAGPQPGTVNTVAANDDSPKKHVRDDAEILKEIARRIREGHKSVATAASPDDATDRDDQTHGAESMPPRPVITTEIRSASWDKPSDTPQPLPRREPIRTLAPDELSNLAHELKTPLTAIAAAAEIMRDEQLGAMGNPKYLNYASDIHDSARHALDVISSMLTADNTTTGDGTGLDAIDLNDLAVRTVSTLQPLATQRSLSLDLDGEPGLSRVRANTTAIRQILMNLLTNALKFTPRGGDVRVVTGYLDDGAVFFAVRDTGDGMTTVEIENAFDDTGPTPQLRPGGGRGIGLKLVRKLAAENGANFEIDSAPGKGTVVLISFARDLTDSV